MTPTEKQELLGLLEEQRRRKAATDLHAFCRHIEIPGAPINDDEGCEEFYPDNVAPAAHHDLLNDALMRVAAGEIPRLMVFMPPGSAKSTYASVTFPAWYMGGNPGKNIITTCYGTTLARKFGRKVRQITRSVAYAAIFNACLVADNRAVDDWALTNGATYMTGGILSGITGNRADGLIIDDPVKGHEDADSIIIRDKTWDAYRTDLRTRLKPGGWQIIIQTRWHEDDLSGRILPADYDGQSGWITSKQGEAWYVICLQAQCEREDDPLGRQYGDWLWTEWFTPEHWQRERAVQGERNWSALYQQRPKPAEGALIKRAWPKRYNTPPAAFFRIVQSWDTAYKDREINDPSVCETWGETREGNFYLLHVWRDRVEYPSLKRIAASLYQQWKPHAVLVEDKSSGQSLIQEMRVHTKVPVIAIQTTRKNAEGKLVQVNKTDRLVRISSLWEAGRVYLPAAAPWLPDYESEIFGYPLVTNDDQVDSTSQALEWMYQGRGSYDFESLGQHRVGLISGDQGGPRIDDDDGYGTVSGNNEFGGFI